MSVKITERGWGGHFCCAPSCMFRRNTLLEKNGVYVVVSTVGSMVINKELEEVGHGRFYETMAFFSKSDDQRYHDADVSKQIDFDSDWAISEKDADDKANEMHDIVVEELSKKLEEGFLTE
jgi:hypothetical protein